MLIIIGIIFAYMIIGYIIAVIVLTITDRDCDDLPFDDEKHVMITLIWPIYVVLYGSIMLFKLIWRITEFIGKKLAVVPVTVAVIIKAIIDKKNRKVNMENTLIINKIKESRNQKPKGFNRMGCSENWYNPYFAIGQAFDDEILDTMTQTEIDHLIKLAKTIGEAFY